MEIAIKSECDSRVLVYPLIKALYNYGTIAVYSNNKALCRLIENELEGGFKNVRIVVNTEADLEEIKAADDYVRGKYDYVIYDNVGSADCDMLICMITNHLSEDYMGELLFVAADPKMHIIKFGSPAPAPKAEKSAKKSKPGTVEEQENTDASFNKWDVEKTDEEVLQELLSNRESKWVKFPTYDAIEMMESRHKMMIPDSTLLRELYRLFGSHLAIDERQFTKGATIADESSSDISGTDVR